MAMQWFRSAQIQGLAGQVVDLVRYSDAAHVGRFEVLSGGYAIVEYGEVLGDCYAVLHDGSEELIAAWPASQAVTPGSVWLSPELPGYALRCAIGGVTGSSAPSRASIRPGWVHRLDLQGAYGDIRIGYNAYTGAVAASIYAKAGSYWNVYPAAEDGLPNTWPLEDVLMLAGTIDHVFGLKKDGTLLVKAWTALSPVLASYNKFKAVTGVVHIASSKTVIHIYKNDGTVQHLDEKGDPVAVLGSYDVLPGWGQAPATDAMQLIGGKVYCKNSYMHGHLNPYDGVVHGITCGDGYLAALLLDTGVMIITNPLENITTTVNPELYGNFVEFGASPQVIWVVTDTGMRFSRSRNPQTSTTLNRKFAVTDWTSGFQGLGVEQMALLSCPHATYPKMMLATPLSFTTLYRYNEDAALYGNLKWRKPEPRLILDGTALMYANPINATLIRPLWSRSEYDGEVILPGGGATVLEGDPAYLDGVVEEIHPIEGTVRPLANAEVNVFEWRGDSYVAMGRALSGVQGEFRVDTQFYGGGDVFSFASDFPGVTWRSNLVLGVGDRVRPSVNNGYVYEVVGSGNTGATEPTWWADSGDGTEGAIGTATAKARPYYQPVGHGPLKMTLV